MVINTFYRNVIDLVLLALGKEAQTPQITDFEELYSLSKSHQIINIIYYGLKAAKIQLSEEVEKRFSNPTYKYVFLNQRQLYEIKQVCAAFEENKIDYMPLKGAILKHIYPKSDIRVMSDVDILIRLDQYTRIRRVMETLGYTQVCESDHELIWGKGGSTSIELHKRLIPSYNKDYYAYYKDGWSKAIRDTENGNSRYKLSPEDNFIYIFTHFSKHYREGGIGVRHLIDIYMLLSQDLDFSYIEQELDKLQLLEFYKNIYMTIDTWFNNKEGNAITDLITEIIFKSGSYGSDEGHILAKALKETKNGNTVSKTRLKRIISVLFPDYYGMCIMYPVVKKMPILLPFMWVYRWIYKLLFKYSRVKRQSDNVKSLKDKNVNEYKKALHCVGLDFNFEE